MKLPQHLLILATLSTQTLSQIQQMKQMFKKMMNELETTEQDQDGNINKQFDKQIETKNGKGRIKGSFKTFFKSSSSDEDGQNEEGGDNEEFKQMSKDMMGKMMESFKKQMGKLLSDEEGGDGEEVVEVEEAVDGGDSE